MDIKKLVRQNEIIISLLGRMVFTPEQIKQIILKGKRKSNRDNYVKGYNECDGEKPVIEIAQIIGIDDSNLYEIMEVWEEIGIIYEVDKPSGKFYKRLMQI